MKVFLLLAFTIFYGINIFVVADDDYSRDSFYNETKLFYCYDGKQAAYYAKFEGCGIIDGTVFQVVNALQGLLVTPSRGNRRNVIFIKTCNYFKYTVDDSVSLLCIPDGTFSYINSLSQERTINQFVDVTITPEIHKKFRAEIWEDWGEKKRRIPITPKPKKNNNPNFWSEGKIWQDDLLK